MKTAAIAWYWTGWILLGGMLSSGRAIALPSQSTQEPVNSEAEAILPYPDTVAVPIYPAIPPAPNLEPDTASPPVESSVSAGETTSALDSEPILPYPDVEVNSSEPILLYPEAPETEGVTVDQAETAWSPEPILPYPDVTAVDTARPEPSPDQISGSARLAFPQPRQSSSEPSALDQTARVQPLAPAPGVLIPVNDPPSLEPADARTAPITPNPSEPQLSEPQLSEPQLNDPNLDQPVLDVQIIGVEADLQQLARDVIQLQPGAIATAANLTADRAALASTAYFRSASVSLQPQSTPEASGVVVVYAVEPIIVRSLQLLGAEALPPEVFAQAVQPQENQPISPRQLSQAADQINGWYFDNGYTLAGVQSWIIEPDGTVILEVVEPVVRAIAIQFVEDGSPLDESGDPVEGRTREDFIRRELRTETGSIFNQNDVVSDLETLNRLGVFQEATVAIDVDDTPQPPTVDVIYQVEEGFGRNIRVGGGISTELGLFGSINYRDRNFRGVGEEINLGVQAGGRGLQFNTGFTRPYRASQPNSLGYSINAFRSNYQSLTFSDEVELDNGDTAREQRFGGGVSVMRPLGAWDAELGVDYQRVSIRDDDGDVTNQDELGNQLTVSDSGIDDLLLLGFSVTQDQRINPFNPSGGSILRLSTEQSVPVGNGSIFMNRLRANYARYVPVDVLGSGSLQNPEVVALNLQGGTVLGELPPYEAFDLGGSSSVRGYRGGEVGSGRSYILASAEYRFPIFSIVGGVLFADLASDLGSGSSVEGEPAEVRDKPGTGLGYGFGIRVGSPLGLIRADFGLNDQGDSRLHFGFGQRF